jgi:Fur family ferric uptake transcriptional regulator
VPPEDVPSLLRAANLRVTGPRVAVLELLAEHRHVSADVVMRELRARSSVVSYQAVYDVLGALTAAGLVRRIQPAGHATLYERRAGDNHHHLVCRSCDRVEDVDCAVGSAPCLQVSDARGFAVQEAEIIWWGLCAECAPNPS